MNLSGIVTVSNSGLKSIKKRNFVKKLKLRIIYNGVNKLRANKVFKNKNKLKIIMIAVFEKRKGFDFIFSSLKILKKELHQFKFFIRGL